ncbi:hypothetical protein HHJ74_07800 [Mobiluncus mulieris]|uniref:Uncharacterized protein n=1 Tax=Mobiluncus mulieris TaxID=2052 RepID=A0A848RU49_9ACTO|nr:hypothetical protein [Mobiluncus mulieris]NMW62276.1 hypothetical protein [Mobiluncus mulieris]NMW93596.1 hypothetical protein [Mobiluncus mulieris]
MPLAAFALSKAAWTVDCWTVDCLAGSLIGLHQSLWPAPHEIATPGGMV